MSHLVRDLLSRFAATTPRRTRSRQSSFQLECLEDRTLLSNFFVDAAAGSDANPGTFAQPFATIQRAVDEADESVTAGADTIYVKAGTYLETVSINDGDPLLIQRFGLGIVTVDADGGGNTFEIDDSDVTIRQLTITGATSDGIDADGSGSLRLESVVVTGNDDDGVEVDDLTSLVVIASQFNDNGEDGIDADDVTTVTIQNSQANDNDDDGIQIDDAVTVVVENTTANNNGDDGLDVDDDGSVTESITVQGGTFNNNDDDALDLEANADGAVVSVDRAQASDNDGRGLNADNFLGAGGSIVISNLQANENDLEGVHVNDYETVELINVVAMMNVEHGVEVLDADTVSVSGGRAISNSDDGWVFDNIATSLFINNALAQSNTGNGFSIFDSVSTTINFSRALMNAGSGLVIFGNGDGTSLSALGSWFNSNGVDGLFANDVDDISLTGIRALFNTDDGIETINAGTFALNGSLVVGNGDNDVINI